MHKKIKYFTPLLFTLLVAAGCNQVSNHYGSNPSGANSTPPTSTLPTGQNSGQLQKQGISGQLVLQPTCPVETPGQSCAKPYPYGQIIIENKQTGVSINITADSNGNFKVDLTVGEYMVSGASNGLPRLQPQTITVSPGMYAMATFFFDTGIR